MNGDVKNTVLTRIVLVAAGAAAMSYFFVKPSSLTAAEMERVHDEQSEYIDLGEREMVKNIDQVEALVSNMRAARDAIVEDLTNDVPAQTHQQLQRLAVDRGLTVTRVEPTKSSIHEAKTGSPLQSFKVEEKEFRIECQGAFSGVVAFVDDIQRSPGQPRVSNFRMIPTDENRVRASVTINLIELIEFPEQMKSAFGPSNDRSSESQEDSSGGDA